VNRRPPRAAVPGRLPRSPFGLVDELSCYYDTPAEPNNVHLEVLVPGPVDHLALRQAVSGAIAAAPRAHGRMAAGRAFRRRYVWEFPPVPDVDPLSHATWSDERELAAVRAGFLASSPPLHTSPPVRLLLASGPGASCVILNAHHAALDGMSSLELLRDIAGRYGAITAATAGDSAGARPPADVPPGPSAQDRVLAAVPRAPAPPPGAPARAPGRAHLRAVLRYPAARVAPERQRRERRDGYGLRLLPVPSLPRPSGATVNDLLVAALIATISRWNAAHQRPHRAISITIPVNARGPGQREVAGNHSRTATVTVEPKTAAADPLVLLAAVTRQTGALRQARPTGASAGALGFAPGWCPVALKRLAVRFALRAVGRVVCDTAMLTNLGNVADPPWSGHRGPVRMALSGPAHMPRGVSVAAVTADGQLQLGFRYRYALFDEAAAARFAATYAAALDELARGAAPRPRAGLDIEGGDTGGPAGVAAQDPRVPGRQGLAHVLRRRGPAVQPAPEARLPDRGGRPGDAGRTSRASPGA
jgi:NRPS condensation-like uncharacterized protein